MRPASLPGDAWLSFLRRQPAFGVEGGLTAHACGGDERAFQ